MQDARAPGDEPTLHRPAAEGTVPVAQESLVGSAAELDALAPGAAMASVLAELDPALLAPDAQLAYAAACERLAGWVQSRQQLALVAYAGAEPRITRYRVDGRDEELVDARRSHVARRLLWSEAMAHQRLTDARTLQRDLPETRAALAAGRVSALRASALAEAARLLTQRVDVLLAAGADARERQHLFASRATLLAGFEQRVVGHATRHDLARTRARARVVIAALDPQGLTWRRAQAEREQTTLGLRHEADAMSTLSATLPSELALACLQAVDAAVTRHGADPGHPYLHAGEQFGRRRALALHGLLTGGLPNQHRGHDVCTSDVHEEQGRACAITAAPTPGQALTAQMAVGPHVQLRVTIDLPTLLGLRERPAQLAAVGPIPAAIVRDLVAGHADASLRWLVTDATGTVVDASPHRYRVGAALRALVDARFGTCAMPNCGQPAERCDLDHVVPFAAGGTSTLPNLQPLCRRHHLIKTHAAWPGHSSSEHGSPPEACAAVPEIADGVRAAAAAIDHRFSEWMDRAPAAAPLLRQPVGDDHEADWQAAVQQEPKPPHAELVDSVRASEVRQCFLAGRRVEGARWLLRNGCIEAGLSAVLQLRQSTAAPAERVRPGSTAGAAARHRGTDDAGTTPTPGPVATLGTSADAPGAVGTADQPPF